ncbi:MAG: nucleotidyltransferase family protein [Endomicrobiia bacterium]|nr:nucleotidyltransferase family protein [Endomicrobiia bacterium]
MNETLFANIAALGSIVELSRLATSSDIYLLKGAAIISVSDAAASSRIMEDTDILAASPDDYKRVAEALARMGFAKRMKDSQTYEYASGRARPFDVHDGLWYASRAELESILAASRRADGMPPNVKIFSPEDLCADIIIHAAGHGGLDDRWRGDIEIIASRFGRRTADLGRAKAMRFCARLEISSAMFRADGGGASRRKTLSHEGFIRRFAILGTLKKKAAYAAAVLFPSGYFIARRYDASSAPAMLFYRCARPFALLAAALSSAASAISPAIYALVSKSRRLLSWPPRAKPS